MRSLTRISQRLGAGGGLVGYTNPKTIFILRLV